MAPQKDNLGEVVFTLPGEAQLIRISGKDRSPVASGLFSIIRFVPFPAPPSGAALYCAEVHKTRVYFSQTPGSCVHTSPRHYAFADNEIWLGLSLPEGIGVKEIKQLEELLVKHAGLEGKGTGQPPGPPSGGVRTGEAGEGQVVRTGPTGQLSLETLSAAASPYVKELQKQAIVLAAIAGPHVERAAPHVAQGIEKGSDALAQAIVYGAEKCSSGLAAGGEFVSQKVAPAKKPTEVMEEDRIKAQRIRQVTGVAAKGEDGFEKLTVRSSLETMRTLLEQNLQLGLASTEKLQKPFQILSEHWANRRAPSNPRGQGVRYRSIVWPGGYRTFAFSVSNRQHWRPSSIPVDAHP